MLHYARVQKTTLSLDEAKEGILVGPVDLDLFKEMAEVGEELSLDIEAEV